MTTVYYAKAATVLGKFYVATSDIGLCKLTLECEEESSFFKWLHEKFNLVEENYDKNEHIINQLKSYAKGNIKEFHTKFHLVGTPFQKKVWQALVSVPYGTVCSYKDIAVKIGTPKGFRAVGMANNKNNIPIIIPCHRIIGANGSLVGYGGGLDFKRKLLSLEGVTIHEGKAVTNM
ncbi:methylated-DNA--[protein]-cysteine S-methyltransferase [Geosporobacter ferrireducens]|uniref:Methylated-DNA--protein-cysteine methyltransferase n=1 Tax=Geosporobacter ferrireducens TaxID=1424294 RepID=A0A1D8GN72_9FIRM|nr:methylated-DNA--[protein]-cysteine S-methyltransferase [Geosporobacter ferrireducens]AOT72371.1 hypothetical protein Gferi_24170 [Geosporobacter ferrireducens]MTI56373.1 methylated-DNA--[protein]-cysteine S-methyltransferase [Geosporobacter ferrireducens]